MACSVSMAMMRFLPIFLARSICPVGYEVIWFYLKKSNVFVKREQRKLACSAERRKGRMKSNKTTKHKRTKQHLLNLLALFIKLV